MPFQCTPDQFEQIARAFLGEPNRALSTKHELRFGAHGSMSIDLKKCVWFDHEVEQGGDAFGFVKTQTGGSDRETFAWIERHGFKKGNGHDAARDPFKNVQVRKDGGKQFRIVETWPYLDEAGAELFQVCRLENGETGEDGKPVKKYSQRHKVNGAYVDNVKGRRQVPYSLPELIEGIALEKTVFVVEGEKCADAVAALGCVATCNAMGAGKWPDELTPHFEGADVVILADNNKAGADHASLVASKLAGVARCVRILTPPVPDPKDDVVEWIAAGGTLEKLYELVETSARAPDADVSRDPPGGEENGETKPIVLRGFNPADWEGRKAPPRRWAVLDYIPYGTVASLYADGGGGKGYLGLQLAVARALGKEWIGLMPEQGRTLVLSTEDDLEELWRRIEGMLPFYKARMADLGDIRLVDLVGENSILGLLSKGIVEPTPMYDALDRCMADFKPGMVILDVLADLFSGEESNRPQVTQFVGLLKRLCRKHDCTILLSAQPSLTGMNTGAGTSGSTAWHNSGRARMYLQAVKTEDGAEPNKNLRTFEGKKNNYGVLGGKFDLEWKDGLYRRVDGPAGFEKMAREQTLNETFLMLLKRLTAQNRPVRATNSKFGAPSLFAAEPDNGGFRAKDFEATMLRLLKSGKIANELETEGPPSRRHNRLVIRD